VEASRVEDLNMKLGMQDKWLARRVEKETQSKRKKVILQKDLAHEPTIQRNLYVSRRGQKP